MSKVKIEVEAVKCERCGRIVYPPKGYTAKCTLCGVEICHDCGVLIKYQNFYIPDIPCCREHITNPEEFAKVVELLKLKLAGWGYSPEKLVIQEIQFGEEK